MASPATTAAVVAATPDAGSTTPSETLALMGWEHRFTEQAGGQLRQIGDCWYLVDDGERALVVFPPGSELGPSGDTVVTPDGLEVAHEQQVVMRGLLDGLIGPPPEVAAAMETYFGLCNTTWYMIAADVRLLREVTTESATDTVRQLDGSEYTSSGNCGLHKMVARTEDLQVVIWIFPPRGEFPATGDEIALPAPGYSVHVAVGDLQLTDFCDDVDGALDTPREGVRFDVVGGALRAEAVDLDPDDCGSSSFELALRDLRVSTPAGEHQFAEPIAVTASSTCLPG